MSAWLMDGSTVSLLSQLEPMNPSPCGPFPIDLNHRVGLTAWGCLTIISLTSLPRPPRTASPCKLFQPPWLPWSVDLAREHAPFLTPAYLLSGGASSRSARLHEHTGSSVFTGASHGGVRLGWGFAEEGGTASCSAAGYHRLS